MKCLMPDFYMRYFLVQIKYIFFLISIISKFYSEKGFLGLGKVKEIWLRGNGLILFNDKILTLGSLLLDAIDIFITIPGIFDKKIPYKFYDVNPKYRSSQPVEVPHNIGVIILTTSLERSMKFGPINVCSEDFLYQAQNVSAYAFIDNKIRRFYAKYLHDFNTNAIHSVNGVDNLFNGAPIVLKDGPNTDEVAIGLVACELNEQGVGRGTFIPISENVAFIWGEHKPKPKFNLCGTSH